MPPTSAPPAAAPSDAAERPLSRATSSAAVASDEPAACLYRGVVTHARWRPRRHAFAYEIFNVCVDVDRIEAAFGGSRRAWWPLAGVDAAACVVGLRQADHMKLNRRPGQPLGDAVRDAVETATGWRPPPPPVGRILMVTMPTVAGYSFNPVSFYYVYDGPRLDTVISEVTNTPWGEMHYYVAREGAPGVTSLPVWTPASSSAPAAANPDADAAQPVGIETPALASALVADGAVRPTDYDALADRFPEPGSAACSSTPTAAASAAAAATTPALAAPAPPPPPPTKLRFRWAKDFHVSPFMSITDQEYEWVYSAPPRDLRCDPAAPSTLLVQSQNLRRVPVERDGGADGSSTNEGGAAPYRMERMFHTQLRMVRAPLSAGSLAYLVFVAFPLLTLRVQWWIHVEAARLWWKGVELYAHPTGASNGFVRTVEVIFTPIAWVASAVGAVVGWFRGSGSGGSRDDGSKRKRSDELREPIAGAGATT